jgi:hypothetical protein
MSVSKMLTTKKPLETPVEESERWHNAATITFEGVTDCKKLFDQLATALMKAGAEVVAPGTLRCAYGGFAETIIVDVRCSVLDSTGTRVLAEIKCFRHGSFQIFNLLDSLRACLRALDHAQFSKFTEWGFRKEGARKPLGLETEAWSEGYPKHTIQQDIADDVANALDVLTNSVYDCTEMAKIAANNAAMYCKTPEGTDAFVKCRDGYLLSVVMERVKAGTLSSGEKTAYVAMLVAICTGGVNSDVVSDNIRVFSALRDALESVAYRGSVDVLNLRVIREARKGIEALKTFHVPLPTPTSDPGRT